MPANETLHAANVLLAQTLEGPAPVLPLMRADLIPIVAIIGGLTLGAIALIGAFVASVLNTRARETTRREISAYVAEGSITAEEAQQLIEAGDDEDE